MVLFFGPHVACHMPQALGNIIIALLAVGIFQPGKIFINCHYIQIRKPEKAIQSAAFRTFLHEVPETDERCHQLLWKMFRYD